MTISRAGKRCNSHKLKKDIENVSTLLKKASLLVDSNGGCSALGDPLADWNVADVSFLKESGITFGNPFMVSLSLDIVYLASLHIISSITPHWILIFLKIISVVSFLCLTFSTVSQYLLNRIQILQFGIQVSLQFGHT